ncbi:MAG: hypothetical protein ACKVXR_07315 [Planctomycetota bacterium]
MIGAAMLVLAEITARLRTEPAEAQVGEPVLWILEVEHPAGAAVRLPETDPIPDDGWVLLEPRRVVGGQEITRATWSVLSLEPGDRALPAFAVQVESNGVARSIEVESSTLAVRSALEAGEDAPRPIRGFHEAPEHVSGRGFWLWLAALALLGAALFLWIRIRSRKRPPAVALPAPLERLAELSRQIQEDPESGRKTIYALTRLLRESSDRLLGEDRAALVDPDWAALREADERLPLGARTTIARILRDAERVKYALHAPTRFALEALLADARNALEALAEARPTREKAA